MRLRIAMVHLFGISLAQQFLIVVGAMFQIGAYGVFTKESAEARLVAAAQKERQDAEAEAARREETARTVPEQPVLPKIVRYRRHVEGVMEHVAEDVRPADLLRTAKVRFKHSLEAYQGETQTMPTFRRDAGSTRE